MQKLAKLIDENSVYLAIKKVIPAQPCWIIIHSSLIHFDFKNGNMKWSFLKAIRKLVDKGYTVAFPSFTFSFTRTGLFDGVLNTSETGVLADWVFQMNDSIKTHHPIYSHVLVGVEAEDALEASTETCFGADSIFAMFEQKNAILTMLGCDWKYCTSFHYFEEKSGVPYRFFKKFYYKNDLSCYYLVF